MIKDMHNTTGQTAKVCYAVAATLTGTAYLMPVLVAASPAIQSTVATLATNPTVVSIQSFMYGGMSEYAGANMLTNAVGQSIGNGGDISKVNPVEVVASGMNGFGPVVFSSLVNLSPYANNNNEVFNDFNTTTNNVIINSTGGILKNNLRMSNSMVPNASFSTMYHGMLDISVDAAGTSTSNKVNEKK